MKPDTSEGVVIALPTYADRCACVSRQLTSVGACTTTFDHSYPRLSDKFCVRGLRPAFASDDVDSVAAQIFPDDRLPQRTLWILIDEWSSLPLDLQPFLADLLSRSALFNHVKQLMSKEGRRPWTPPITGFHRYRLR
jgi:hypothetical protein